MKALERLQYLVLALTIMGQVCIGVDYMLGQGLWLMANLITVGRNCGLDRPRADKVQGVFMLALTCGLMVSHFFCWLGLTLTIVETL